MSFPRSSSAYPLDALHLRERWQLDAVRSQLAVAILERDAAGGRHDEVQRQIVAAAMAATQAPQSVIDPAKAARHLSHLAELRRKEADARRALSDRDASCDRVREATRMQQIKLEAIDRHRARFDRAAEADGARRHAVETERDWLARHDWTKREARQADPADMLVERTR